MDYGCMYKSKVCILLNPSLPTVILVITFSCNLSNLGVDQSYSTTFLVLSVIRSQTHWLNACHCGSEPSNCQGLPPGRSLLLLLSLGLNLDVRSISGRTTRHFPFAGRGRMPAVDQRSHRVPTRFEQPGTGQVFLLWRKIVKWSIFAHCSNASHTCIDESPWRTAR